MATAFSEQDVPEEALRIRYSLDDARDVDARRIDVVVRPQLIVLRGWVATGDESVAAELLAESESGSLRVRNELQVDPNLREGLSERGRTLRTIPPEDEMLVGSTDMLAGDDAE